MIHQIDFLRELTLLSIVLRTALAVVAGLIIGAERRNKNHAAGLRTHMLVTVGAALLMTTAQFASEYFGGGDITRIGAQAVSGIGFLGAGTIMIAKGRIRGLTTAAGLWATTCIGLAIGIGFYEGAILGLVAVFFTLVFLRRVSHINKNPGVQVSVSEFALYMEGKESLSELARLMKELGLAALKLEIKPCGNSSFNVDLSFSTLESDKVAALKESLGKIDGTLIFEIHTDGQASVIGD